jgi:hypothetical protein
VEVFTGVVLRAVIGYEYLSIFPLTFHVLTGRSGLIERAVFVVFMVAK